MKHILFGTRIVENIIYLNSVSNHCYHYNVVLSSHLVLFFLISNLAHVCSEICFGEGSYCAGTIQLICGANHLTGSCMVRVFAGGCFRADFCCLIFCKYRFYHWFNLNVTELLKSSIVFYLSIHADRCCFVASKSRYF